MLTAIDPGIPLTVCYHDNGGDLAFVEGLDISISDKCKPTSPLKLAALLRSGEGDVVVERVSIYPGEDVAIGALFVGSMYQVIGACAALRRPCYAVPPSVWKRKLGVPGKGAPGAARAVCGMAGERWPTARALFGVPTRHHNRADAALLAAWFIDNPADRNRWKVT